MTLPIRTTLEDVQEVCAYLSRKPTGSTVAEGRKILDSKFLDGRKISALRSWGLIEEAAGRLKVTERGRAVIKDDANRKNALLQVIRSIEPYWAVVERAGHRHENSITATDVGAHWHEHFPEQAADSDKILNDQAVCFFQLASGAGLGEIVIGRHGMPTRFEFESAVVEGILNSSSLEAEHRPKETFANHTETEVLEELERSKLEPSGTTTQNKLGQAIFVAHGKNKKPLDQLKRILDQFKIPFRVATDEPNLGRPIGSKVREIMESCNCAILIFTADEEFKNAQGDPVWRPSENVVFELGASGYLYGNRIVIMKEEGVDFPTNFRDLGYISFSKDQLEAKAMEILRELIGFGIVKVST
ncbi:MAG: TIR domain-containing protein [Candidatus Korobacteraceae bacterium]